MPMCLLHISAFSYSLFSCFVTASALLHRTLGATSLSRTRTPRRQEPRHASLFRLARAYFSLHAGLAHCPRGQKIEGPCMLFFSCCGFSSNGLSTVKYLEQGTGVIVQVRPGAAAAKGEGRALLSVVVLGLTEMRGGVASRRNLIVGHHIYTHRYCFLYPVPARPIFWLHRCGLRYI